MLLNSAQWPNNNASPLASSETQGQLVGTTGFSWAKVYNKSRRAPGHLLLPNEYNTIQYNTLYLTRVNILTFYSSRSV